MIQLNNKIYVLEKCVKLIKREQTGTCDEFAKKLNISRGKLFHVIEDFRNLGLKIEYKRHKKSYVLEGNKTIRFNKLYEVIAKDELPNINGGSLKKRSLVHFFGLDAANFVLENSPS